MPPPPTHQTPGRQLDGGGARRRRRRSPPLQALTRPPPHISQGANWPVEGQDDDVPFDPYCDLETRAEVTGPAGRRTGRAGMSEGADG